jgi:hypothetical protein
MGTVLDKIVDKIETHIFWPITSLPPPPRPTPKIVPFMRQFGNMVQPHRPEKTI